MMDDLSDAKAAVIWGNAHLPTLERRVLTWNERAVEVVRKYPDLNPGRQTWVAREKEPLPILVYGDVGAIIGSFRSALDLLAAALAKRNGVPPNHDTRFPTFRSMQDFLDPLEGMEGKKWLPRAEIAIIKSLKPYEGGNNLLWRLHQLDILRKHKRLISVVIKPFILNVIAFGATDHGPIVSAIRRLENETILVELPAAAPEPQIQTTLTIAFNELALGISGEPAVPLLRQFGEEVAGIIALFDIP